MSAGIMDGQGSDDQAIDGQGSDDQVIDQQSQVEAPQHHERRGEHSSQSIALSYDYAARLTKAEAKNFFYSFRFLPPERRRSIFAIYAFSRRADDTVDAVEEHASSPEEANQQLDYMRSMIGPNPPDDPLTPALLDSIERFSIPVRPFEELLAGMQMDLVKTRYKTFDELYEYCYRAASVVGLICIEIFGYKDAQAHEPAIKLGIAMQLTNILRDVAEDQARDRIYLPSEDLQKFGYSESDLSAGVINSNFRELMSFQVARARRFFEESKSLYPLVLSESRYCPILLMRFYSRILDRIEQKGYDVLSRRPTLPKHEKLLIAGSTWITSRFGRN